MMWEQPATSEPVTRTPEELTDDDIGKTIMLFGALYRIVYVVQETVRTRIGTAAPVAGARADIVAQMGIDTVQVVLEGVDPAEVVAEQERLGREARERLADFWHGGRAQRAEYARQAKSREQMTRFVRARVRAAKGSLPAGYDVEKVLTLLEDEDTDDELLHLVAMLWQAHPLFRAEWKV